MKVEPAKLGRGQAHNFFGSLIVPRPIAFVSTVGPDGIYNAAPFSAFIRLTLEPPVLCLAIAPQKGKKKDTVRNIEFSGDFVVNMVDESLAKAMKQASYPYPSDVDEIKEVGLTALPSEKVKSPRIAESPINLECQLMQIMEFGKRPASSIIFGEVVLVHIRDDIWSNGEVDPRKAKIIGRLAGDLFCYTTNIFELKFEAKSP